MTEKPKFEFIQRSAPRKMLFPKYRAEASERSLSQENDCAIQAVNEFEETVTFDAQIVDEARLDFIGMHNEAQKSARRHLRNSLQKVAPTLLFFVSRKRVI